MSRRIIMAMLTVGSLLLTAAIAAVWVRSLTDADWLSHSHATRIGDRYARTEWIILSGYGFMSFTKANTVPIDDASVSWLNELDKRSRLGWSLGLVDSYPFSWEGFAGGLRRIGFSSGTDRQGRTTRYWKAFEVPDWLILLVVSVPAQLALIRRVRARHRAGFPVVAGTAITLRSSGDGA